MHYSRVRQPSSAAQSAHLKKLGRRLGVAFFSLVVAAFTAICTVQICLQVWAAPILPLDVGCEAGILRLAEAVNEARRVSWNQPGERLALGSFRNAVAPAWALRPALGRACASDPKNMARLREVDRLRYAEEHAVRYGAVDLAERRMQVERMIPILRQGAERDVVKAPTRPAPN